MVQSLSPKLSADTPKNTLYFRSATELAPFQESNILLTANEQLPNHLSDAIFTPAHKIEQMQVKNIEQSDKYANEYIAQVSNGKNKNFFNLGQNLAIYFILFVSYF